MNLSPPGAHLPDTSAVILLMQQKLIASHKASVPFAVRGELNTGIFRADQREKEVARIQRAIGPTETILPTLDTPMYFGRITAHLQRLGQMIPVNDIWNAAQALEHDLPPLAADVHFRRVPGLRFLPVR